jgi:hypothetical protein
MTHNVFVVNGVDRKLMLHIKWTLLLTVRPRSKLEGFYSFRRCMYQFAKQNIKYNKTHKFTKRNIACSVSNCNILIRCSLFEAFTSVLLKV